MYFQNLNSSWNAAVAACRLAAETAPAAVRKVPDGKGCGVSREVTKDLLFLHHEKT